ncbi:uncharacterized protein LOC112565798 isoform X2 [Pomacea canaliculata]|uniref:uncharacterized protein LOC112565798 isoform X2 n=1 Tax=Pomacea canaliculata TaxID=400727 RepID=UPI000D726DC2|nr:uncharacterized protein LOC112565798 isoform X2 [Pomacea canaliculata]
MSHQQQPDDRKGNRKSVSFRKMASRLLSRKKSFSCVVTAPLPVPRRKMSKGDFECEGIAFIQTKDALDWAKFLQSKLYSPDYNIRTTLYSPDHSDIKNVFLKANTCAVLVSPMMLEAENSDFWRRCKDKFHWRTVFLLLGVDKAELGEDMRRNISSCKLMSVDGSPDTVKNTLVKLIEVYESTEDPSKSSTKEWEDEKIYDYPPPPRQLNSVVKVLPTVIYENGREALIVLEREAEQEVYLLQVGNQSSHPIKLDHVAGSAYLAKMPDDVNGKVDFFVMTGEQTLSQLTLTIQTRLEQLAALLEQETSPLALLCSAMGLPSAKYSSNEELDSLLASRLEAVQYPQTLSTILSADEHLSSDQENCRWPTFSTLQQTLI